MARKSSETSTHRAKPRRKRPGVHAKSRTDVNKRGRHWKKPYRGQGK